MNNSIKVLFLNFLFLVPCTIKTIESLHILPLTADALANSLAHVHQNTIDLFFQNCSPAQKKAGAVQLARSAALIMCNLPPRVIACMAQADDEAALILAHAAAKQRDAVDAMCIHTIPMLAKINTQTYALLSPLVKEFSPLDKYLFTEHSGSGMICAACKGSCKFKEDNLIENFAKLIKGVRAVVLVENEEGTQALPPELTAMAETQKIYSHSINTGGGITRNIWFTPEGEQQAKLFKFFHECAHDLQFPRNVFSDYTFSKILGYKDEDIEFFYEQSNNCYGRAGNNLFIHDKECGDAWLLEAPEKLEHMAWNPEKLF